MEACIWQSDIQDWLLYIFYYFLEIVYYTAFIPVKFMINYANYIYTLSSPKEPVV